MPLRLIAAASLPHSILGKSFFAGDRSAGTKQNNRSRNAYLQCCSSPSGNRSATRFKLMLCSSSAFSPASTSVNPSVEPIAASTTLSMSPLKPEFVMVTKVVLSGRGTKIHSTVVGAPYADHSIRIRLFCSTAFTLTSTEKSYISQSHLTCAEGSNLPLPLVNQNLDVMAGSTNASNTSETGRRINSSAFADGIDEGVIVSSGESSHLPAVERRITLTCAAATTGRRL